jgi:malonate transporter and related proteins
LQNQYDFWLLLQTALSISAPTFGWVLLGLVLNRAGLFPEAWVNKISRLAFNFGLPLMLFAGSMQVDLSNALAGRYVVAGVAATGLGTALAWYYSQWRGHARAVRGIFVQGAFRSNLAIVGFALCVSAYGELGVSLSALPIAVLTILYNVLAVWVLDSTLGLNTSMKTVAVGVIRNPLIIGICAGLLVALTGVPVPQWAPAAGAGLSSFFLPLMLGCIGATMKLANLRSVGAIAWEVVAWRLLLVPILALLLALLLGVRGESLGVLYLLVSSPVATASFVMVVAAKGDGVLAANLIVLTTVCSVITVTAGFMLLVFLGLVGQPV